MISHSTKAGTLERRVERRMALAGIDDVDRYIELLAGDGDEPRNLADDLFINVTRFFRDKKAFDLLAETIVPELTRAHPADRPIRIWVAGCSTGEEAYSIAMLFLEQIAAARRGMKLQIFASDIDADAIATAREGLYPPAIEADVAAERLSRFFTREDHGYRVSRELRSAIVFSVHDVVADAPFSRLDLISLPQSSDLSAARGAAARAFAVPFRVARGRDPVSWPGGIRGRRRR